MTRRKKITFSIIYCVFLLIALEGLSRLALSIDPVFNKVTGEDDSSWRLKWIRRHRDQVEIYYKFDEYDPWLGWRAKPGLRDEPAFSGKRLSTNSKGLRGKREFSYDKPPGTTRIVILGDSFTFGDDVSDHEVYPYYLQQMLPQTEIINLGVHGYGPDQMLLLFKEEGVKYRPDIVILGFVYRDIYRNMLRFRDFAKPRFKDTREGLKAVNIPVPTPEAVLRREWMRPKLVDLWRICSFNIQSRTGRYETRTRELAMAILDEFVVSAEAIGAQAIVIHLPVGFEIVTRQDRSTEGEQFLAEFSQRNHKARCFSTRGHFLKRVQQGKRFNLKGHWYPQGQRTAAEGIREILEANGYVRKQGPPASTK